MNLLSLINLGSLAEGSSKPKHNPGICWVINAELSCARAARGTLLAIGNRRTRRILILQIRLHLIASVNVSESHF
jgi:hypothetical protein